MAAELYLINNPLHQIKLALQRCIQKQCKRIELDPQAMTCPLRAGLLQVGALNLECEKAY